MSEYASQEEIELFLKLFDGRRDIYGIAKGTVERNQKGNWNEVFWEALVQHHLEGARKADLGVYLVRDSGTVNFAAVDIDEPDFDLAQEVAELMPGKSWIERSRSGNYHVFVFFDEPLEAYFARPVLRSVIVPTGHLALEIFPKQDALREGMVGNYISAPWHGSDRPIVTTEDGYAWKRSEWLSAAHLERTEAEEWRRRGRSMGAHKRTDMRDSGFGERKSLHVCAEYIFDHRKDLPLEPGHRATVLFNVAKMYANCMFYNQDETEQIIEEINQSGTQPIPSREVKRFVNNAYEGGFTSTGCDDALMMPYTSPECKIAHA